MSWTCAACSGRGWLPPARVDAWPETCKRCTGVGRFRPSQLAAMLSERTKIRMNTMRRYIWLVERGRPHTAAATHVLKGIVKRFPEVLNG